MIDDCSYYNSSNCKKNRKRRIDLRAFIKCLEFDCPKYYDFTKIEEDNWEEPIENPIVIVPKPQNPVHSKSNVEEINNQNCDENEDPNKQKGTKIKYFSKKNHRNISDLQFKQFSKNDKTVEVFLFDKNIDSDQFKPQLKSISNQSPLNKSVEKLSKSSKGNHSSSRSKIGLPVYQKYINQIKRANASNSKESKKKHSSIMSSFISTKQANINGNNNVPMKSSASFVFSNKSPLNTTKSISKPNFILKNKRNIKGLNSSQEEIKNIKRTKNCKRTLSK